jgi:phosphatidylserine/phosphatidylglycerophosphate/cardiolipin synthase-like enzyme
VGASATDRLAERLEDLIHRRHRRRLRRVGWLQALDAAPGTWAADGVAPRPANHVEVLIDGATALPAIAAAVRGTQDHVHLAAWAIDPHFALVRGEDRVTLRELLAEAAERVDVRVLLWGGAPLPVAHPSAREARRALGELCAGTRVRGVLDTTDRWAGACHEKVVIVDGAASSRRPWPATGSTSAAIPVRTAAAGTTRRRACAGRRWPTWRTTSACAGTR